MKAGFEELRERVRALATREGRTDTAFGDLHTFRSDAPMGPTRVETRGVVVAAIADRKKRVEVADGRTLSYGVGSYLFVTREARYLSTIPSHFAHRFRAVARVSPMRYVKQVRLDRARLLMLREGLGASEAADEVGYASPSHFTRDFKAVFGAPPAAYAQRLRDGRS